MLGLLTNIHRYAFITPRRRSRQKYWYITSSERQRIVHIDKCSFSECNQNAENLWKTFELFDSKFAE